MATKPISIGSSPAGQSFTVGLLGAEVPGEYRDAPANCWLSFQLLEAERRILDLEARLQAISDVVQP